MDSHEGITAIILAAGYSSRMGEFKPLLKLGRYTAIEQSVQCFLQAGLQDVRVVAGYRAEEIVRVVKPMGVRVIVNPFFDQGMYSSVQAGVGTLETEVRAFFLLPADHPLVRASTVKRMLECRQAVKKGILYPTFHGRRGHPPLISTGYADRILRGPYPEGLQGFLSEFEHDSFDVAVPDEAVLLDMDKPEDYCSLLVYKDSRGVPLWEDCLGILREARVSGPVWEHCHRVAGIAQRLARCLNEAGAALDEDLVLAGALLHDVARSQPDHARAGAIMLRARGYPLVAEVVAAHMEIEVNEEGPVSETEVVFLADKMVRGRNITSISERFAASLAEHKDDRQACRSIQHRLKQAEKIKKKVDKILGRPVETVLPEGNARDIQY